MFDLTLKILLLISVVSLSMGNEPVNIWDLKIFHIAIFSLFIASFFSNVKRHWTNDKMLSGLSFVGIISCFSVSFTKLSMFTLFNYFFASLGICIIVAYTENPKAIIKWMISGAMINLFVLMFQHLGIDYIVKGAPNIPGGFLGNAPRYSAFIGMLLPFIYEWSIPIFFLSLVTCIYPDINSTTLIIAIIIIWFNCKNKYLRYGIIIGLIIGICLLYEHILYSLKIRGYIYGESLKIYFNKPLLGYGLGASLGNPDIHADNQMQSSFLQYIYATGIAGITYIIIILKSYFKNFTTTALSLSILSLLILCTVEYPLEIRRLWLSIITLISFFIIETIERQKK
jgi:hypothetical protein